MMSDPMLSFAPFFHVLGFTILLYSLIKGVKMLIMAKFDLREYLENIEKHKVSYRLMGRVGDVLTACMRDQS
jgi:acyl-CoA synthetase (AMP-forming)/AMP-acid ligase II